MEPLRIGVLGAARITGLARAGPAHATGARLEAVAARDHERASAFAHQHGVERVLDSYLSLRLDGTAGRLVAPPTSSSRTWTTRSWS